MTDPLPSLYSLRSAARAVFGVLLGASLHHDGELDWREVPLSEQAFAREVSRLAGVAVSVMHGDRTVYSLPPSPALDFLATAFRDPRVIQQIVSLARQVDVVRGGASSRSETLH